jgi:PKD repeat protein
MSIHSLFDPFKKSAIAAFVFIITFSVAIAQQGEWTWMKGYNSTNSGGNFGTQGIPAATNEPPALYGTAKWKDLDGNFWIFGGVGYNPSINNALWKYDPLTNMWTWMKGPIAGNDPGYYGTMGIPSSLNNPGARGYGAAAWVDMNGDLWLYGGNGITPLVGGMLADLWKYHIATNEWTWMAGNPWDYSNFGIQGVPAATNTPGEREECTANWVDANGNLWFYGGLRDGFGSSDGNDMWKFDISTNLWTWMSGGNGVLAPPVYGTQNFFAAGNTPGGRMNYSGWQDADGFFWLFGGENEGTYMDYSDLWKYDPVINQWAWVSGSNIGNNNGNVGAACDTSSLYYPRSRWENRANWQDECGNFWLFGGYYNGDLNDLWNYQPSNHSWAFAGGSLSLNQPGVYGTQGTSSPTNVPGGRMGAVSFYGNDGNLYLFGGTGSYVTYFFNDLWKFVPDPTCPSAISCASLPPTPVINSSDTFLCQKFCIDFFDLSTNNPISWQWIFQGGVPSTSSAQNPAQICYPVPGTYDVTLIATNAFGSDTLTLSDFITVNETPPFPVITQNGYTLTSSPALSYQWQLNATDITGATSQSYTVMQSGLYSVVITDDNGCSSSTSQYVTITGMEELWSNESIAVYPNPFPGQIHVDWVNADQGAAVEIGIFNTLGQRLFFFSEKINTTAFSKVIDLSEFPPGIYFLEMTISKGDEENYSGRKKITLAK